MSGMTGSDTNSPPGQQYGGRKNKLGYTRISVACSIEHGDDAEPSSSKSMPRSQTPSNVSRSPIEAEPDRYPTANPQLSNVPSPLGATTTAFSGNVAIAASQGPSRNMRQDISSWTDLGHRNYTLERRAGGPILQDRSWTFG
ncbi:hypothetical protein ANO11243_007820 [Dothideomycetidae sp. 11243]|nr:hypothetical protein ANO11243_007820 [fungal sp. No.11243]